MEWGGKEGKKGGGKKGGREADGVSKEWNEEGRSIGEVEEERKSGVRWERSEGDRG